MKPKIRTAWTHETIPEKKSSLPSLTIPDQTMTVRELIERHVRGLPLDGEKIPVYYGEDEEMPDIRRMDLSEIQQLQQSTQQTIDEANRAYQDRQEKKKKAEFDKLVEEKAKELNILKKPSPPGNEGTEK